MGVIGIIGCILGPANTTLFLTTTLLNPLWYLYLLTYIICIIGGSGGFKISLTEDIELSVPVPQMQVHVVQQQGPTVVTTKKYVKRSRYSTGKRRVGSLSPPGTAVRKTERTRVRTVSRQYINKMKSGVRKPGRTQRSSVKSTKSVRASRAGEPAGEKNGKSKRGRSSVKSTKSVRVSRAGEPTGEKNGKPKRGRSSAKPTKSVQVSRAGEPSGKKSGAPELVSLYGTYKSTKSVQVSRAGEPSGEESGVSESVRTDSYTKSIRASQAGEPTGEDLV